MPEKGGFDRFCEKSCAGFYRAKAVAGDVFPHQDEIGFFEGSTASVATLGGWPVS
jgi:hypothetical protein